MKEIKMTNRNEFALVDDEDYDKLKQFPWRWHMGYAATGHSNYCNFTFMHDMIIDRKGGFDLDHIDGNKLNNQKVNLRHCTRRQNSMNRGLNKNNTSGYKGVSFGQGKYIVHLSVNRKVKHIGRFDDVHDAAEAYNKASKEAFGEFAFQNTINRPTT